MGQLVHSLRSVLVTLTCFFSTRSAIYVKDFQEEGRPKTNATVNRVEVLTNGTNITCVELARKVHENSSNSSLVLACNQTMQNSQFDSGGTRFFSLNIYNLIYIFLETSEFPLNSSIKHEA